MHFSLVAFNLESCQKKKKKKSGNEKLIIVLSCSQMISSTLWMDAADGQVGSWVGGQVVGGLVVGGQVGRWAGGQDRWVGEKVGRWAGGRWASGQVGKWAGGRELLFIAPFGNKTDAASLKVRNCA